MDNNPDLNPAKFCDIMLHDNGCNFTNIEWTVDVPEGHSPAKDFVTVTNVIFSHCPKMAFSARWLNLHV